MIPTEVPAAAHLHRVLAPRVRQRARRTPRRGRVGGDRIAADAAYIPEISEIHRGHAEIGRVERPGVEAEALRIDGVARNREGLPDRGVTHPRLEEGMR